MTNIKKLNDFIKEEHEKTKRNQLDILMQLAFEAGFEYFNPYRTSDYELNEIIKLIP